MKVLNFVLAAAFAVLASANFAVADDKAKEPLVLESKISKDGKSDPCMGACKINFRTELKVPFDYLTGLGHRIHEARRSPDPVELAACARSLAVAEEVSGKKASVTSTQVMADAVELAKLRNLDSELKAMALMVTDAKTAKELTELSKAAEDTKPEPGEKAKFIDGTLRVMNHTDECLRIFVDGMFVGEVHKGETADLRVRAPNHHNHLDAYCEEGGELVKHAHFDGHAHGTVLWHVHR